MAGEGALPAGSIGLFVVAIFALAGMCVGVERGLRGITRSTEQRPLPIARHTRNITPHTPPPHLPIPHLTPLTLPPLVCLKPLVTPTYPICIRRQIPIFLRFARQTPPTIRRLTLQRHLQAYLRELRAVCFWGGDVPARTGVIGEELELESAREEGVDVVVGAGGGGWGVAWAVQEGGVGEAQGDRAGFGWGGEEGQGEGLLAQQERLPAEDAPCVG